MLGLMLGCVLGSMLGIYARMHARTARRPRGGQLEVLSMIGLAGPGSEGYAHESQGPGSAESGTGWDPHPVRLATSHRLICVRGGSTMNS